MRLALEEAARALGLTAPNPAVGAVIVKGGKVIAKGYHHAAGLPHAEIEAIRRLLPEFRLQSSAFSLQPRPLAGCTLYITLEPCSSYGKTPPCTEAIIAAGITRVVYGATDPDKRHRGRAATILRKAGIEVAEGVLAEQCEALNWHWNHRASTGLPWVIAKAGMSLDGRIDSPPRRRWITSAASRKEAMNRIVWSRSGKIPKKSKLLTDAHRARTLVFTGVTLRKVLQELGKRSISSVLIEGGGHTLGEAFKRNLVDEVRFFIAPVIQGGNIPAVSGHISPAHLDNVTYKKIGSDVMISGMVRKG